MTRDMAFWEDIEWKAWLREYVTWKNEQIPRHAAIRHFCNELCIFLHFHGYFLRVNRNTLKSHIATGLYNSRTSCNITHWIFGEQDADYQHKVYFAHVIDSTEWNKFWNTSAKWCDLDANVLYGLERQYCIEHYVWTQLDLGISKHTRTVNELLGLDDDIISENENHDTIFQDMND